MLARAMPLVQPPKYKINEFRIFFVSIFFLPSPNGVFVYARFFFIELNGDATEFYWAWKKGVFLFYFQIEHDKVDKCTRKWKFVSKNGIL